MEGENPQMKVARWSLPGNGFVYVTWPKAIPHDEIEDVLRFIDLVKRGIERSVPPTPPAASERAGT